MPDDRLLRIGRDRGDKVCPLSRQIECGAFHHFVCHAEFTREILEEQVVYGDDLHTVFPGWCNVLIVCCVNIVLCHHLRQLAKSAF